MRDDGSKLTFLTAPGLSWSMLSFKTETSSCSDGDAAEVAAVERQGLPTESEVETCRHKDDSILFRFSMKQYKERFVKRMNRHITCCSMKQNSRLRAFGLRPQL